MPHHVFEAGPGTFDSIGASPVGIHPLITMFLVTWIAARRRTTT